MVFMPPRAGKSLIISKYFPAWLLARHPKMEVILASYAAALAQNFSKQVRGLFRDDDFGPLFPKVRLDPESQSSEHWYLQYRRTVKDSWRQGGSFVAAGVGGPVTGKGASVLIIDDPVKNAEEAESQVIRDNIWDWYTSTAYTRLAPGGGVVVVMTRWHEDDLAGRLERMTQNGELDDPFEILRFPAIAEEDEEYRKEGEALHPERFDLTALNRIRKAVGPRVWAALYQQRPAPEEGAYFTKDMFQYYTPEELPKRLNVYATWDLAIGKKERNDFTVGVKFGVCEENKLWILDIVRARMDALEIVDSILDMWESDSRFMMMGIEAGHIQMALGPLLDQRIRERGLFKFYYEPLKPGRQDKEARARSIQGRMRQGLVYWPQSAPWLAEAREELLTFPHGTHDDIVDAVAYAGILLDEFVVPRRPRPEKPQTRDYIKSFVARLRRGERKKHWLAS